MPKHTILQFCTTFCMLHFSKHFPFIFGIVGNTGKNAINRNAIFHITKSRNLLAKDHLSISFIDLLYLVTYPHTMYYVLTWFSQLMQYSPDLIRLLVKWGIGAWTTRFSEYKHFHKETAVLSMWHQIGFSVHTWFYALGTRNPVTYKIPRPIWIDCPLFGKEKKQETSRGLFRIMGFS